LWFVERVGFALGISKFENLAEHKIVSHVHGLFISDLCVYVVVILS
jgi:hypothetical protein